VSKTNPFKLVKTVMERRGDGVGDQGAEDGLLRTTRESFRRVWSWLPCEWLSVQRVCLTRCWHALGRPRLAKRWSLPAVGDRAAVVTNERQSNRASSEQGVKITLRRHP